MYTHALLTVSGRVTKSFNDHEESEKNYVSAIRVLTHETHEKDLDLDETKNRARINVWNEINHARE